MRSIGFLMVFVTMVSCKPGEQSISNSFVDYEMAKPHQLLSTSYSDIPVYSFDEFEKLLKVHSQKTYVVNFWATWCKPCVKEIPEFEKLQNTYGDQQVEVVLVSLDFPNKVESQLLPFVENLNLKSQVILLDDPNQNRWIPKIDKDWSGAIPATLIFNADRREFYEKSFTFMSLEAELQDFLN
ncbi:alkyl hydroperoxide reductase [Galbibacter marinus]|uniref:Alkyl hydroperoxide reductase n=1 Tax=Galbibacter marinus TaxID=555500 RepID=K2P1S4_9FLAO|nr:TlpA disulfide reductase family protein [Galbibacter marinus]EKF54988.1 alkyl hydroperoxide reductase [Galbibacter marinus]